MARELSTKKKVYETIDQVVRGVCKDLEEGLERYETYLHWALKAHKDWHLDQAKEVKTVLLDLNAYKAVDWPDDYVDWTKIGIKYGNQLLTFVHDDYMSFPLDSDDTGNDPDLDADWEDVTDILDSNLVSQDTGGYYFYNNISPHGEDPGRLFGLTAKDNYLGYFRINREREQIQLRSRVSNLTTIYLEYIANGYNPCGESFVHPYAAHLISLFVHWQRLKHKRPYNRGQVQDAKDDYWQEYDRVCSRMFDLTVEDILECSRSGYTLLPIN